MYGQPRRPFASLPWVLVLALLPVGCARTPEGQEGNVQGRQITVSMTVAGRIRQNVGGQVPYHYFVLINFTDDPGDAGPVPVVDIPWGNGFAAPAPLPADRQGFVGFVRVDALQPQGYGVYRVARTDPNNENSPLFNPVTGRFEPLGLPEQYTQLAAESDTIQFRLDLSRLPGYRRPGPDGQLDPPNDPAPDDTTARYVQVNFLATNNLPQGADTNAPKSWDALGGAETGTINTWLTIPLDQDSALNNNTQAVPEQPGDAREKLSALVDDPDLDITDWTIRIE